MIELFDKKFVHFMWDDELEGKKCFVKDCIDELVDIVEKGGSDVSQEAERSVSDAMQEVRYSGKPYSPFHIFSDGEHYDFVFAYYDPNYEVKKAFNEGKKVQAKEMGSLVDWADCDKPIWSEDFLYRIKPDAEKKWIVYLARDDAQPYLTACCENRWESAQTEYGAKTKLLIGSESEVTKWYKSRQKFAEVIKAWEDGKQIQILVKPKECNTWVDCAESPKWHVDNEYRVKPEDRRIVFLARNDIGCYLTSCYESRWKDAQKKYGAKTKLFVGSEDEAFKWYESRQDFADEIKAFEDGKQIQCRYNDDKGWCDVWCDVYDPSWSVYCQWRVKPEEKTVVAKRCSGCAHEHCSATKEPCVSCKPGNSKYEAKEEMEDKTNPIQEKKMRRYNLKVKDWDELKEMAVKMFKAMAVLNEEFAEKISEGGFVTQDDWKTMNGLWKTFNYTTNENKFCKDDLHHLFTEDDLDEEFVEIKAEVAKEEKKYRAYKSSNEFVQDFQERFRIKYNPSWSMPTIWVKGKETDCRYLITTFAPHDAEVGGLLYKFEQLLDDYTYLDGSPVGMEVKE